MGGSSSRCCSWQLAACPARHCTPLLPHSSIHTPASTAVYVAGFGPVMACVLPALQLFAAAKPQLYPPPPLLLPECCPLVRPYAKQLQRQQLLRSWLLHCKCECDCDSESETATRMTTTTVSDAECNLSKKSREKLWQHAGRGGGGQKQSSRDNALLWHKYECHQINMRRIWLTILWYNMLSACNGSCCCCRCCCCCCCLGTLLAA